MLRTAASALVAFAAWTGASAQELPILHVKVSVLDADQRLVPVARHALLISENPTSAVPRRVVTSPEGTAQVRLRPGNYTVESDRPFVLNGRIYEWAQIVDVMAGRDSTLELTAANAVVGRATAELEREAAAAANTPETREASILTTWQASAFGLWTPLVHAAGFLVDERGLVATSLRAIGEATSIEVQITPSVKVTGVVVASDPRRDVAVVRVHPSAVGGVRPVPLVCEAADQAADAPDRYLIDVGLNGAKDVTSYLVVPAGAAGGPVFAADGRAVGLASPAGEADPLRRTDVRVVGAKDVCEVLASARATLDASPAPDAVHLPVEPTQSMPATPVSAATAARVFSLTPYQMSSSDFDITFLTPALLAGADGKRGWTGVRADELNGLRVATEFENWADYVTDAPPVLFVRVTPRLVEGFWMKVARGAASTQGAQIPPIKRIRSGFSRMRLLCNGKDVVPIHPFRIQSRVTETDAVEEGFYAFDPSAIGPDCGTVSIVLSSVKDPDKTETRVVAPAMVKQVWADLATYRATH
ncbi:MAG: serine protease [Acidobacteriota bacterium]